MDTNILKNIKDKLNTLPSSSGVYLMKDIYGNIIYIGKAKNLKNRVSSYFVQTYKPQKVVQMVNNVFTFDFIVTNSELDALNLESNLIKKHMPFYNILLKDGKNHSFIKIEFKKELPTLKTVRKIDKDNAKYFGPFMGGITAYEIVNIINNAFFMQDYNIKEQTDKPYKRENLNVFLGNLKPKELTITKDEYLNEVKKIMTFLSGNIELAKQIITDKMALSAEMENFEKAIEYRNNLSVITKLKNKVVTELKKFVDIDIFGFSTNGFYSTISVVVVRGGKMLGANNFIMLDSSLSDFETVNNFIMQYYQTSSNIPSEIITEQNVDEVLLEWLNLNATQKVYNIVPQKGIKKQLLTMAAANAKEYLNQNIDKEKLQWLKTMGAMEQLKDGLQLKELPSRVECYDISNMQGKFIVASMVVFKNGEPHKKHYRKFKIKSVVGHNDDFTSMKEVLSRRLLELNKNDESFSTAPNLIVIDGGKGQLSVAYEVLKSFGLNIDIVSLAKQQEEIFLPNNPQSIYLNRNNYGLQMLQNIIDEAHRFAITFNRQLRKSNSIKSTLSEIEGVGDKTIKTLYRAFKNIEAIKAASVGDLSQVKGISKKVAENIFSYFNS